MPVSAMVKANMTDTTQTEHNIPTPIAVVDSRVSVCLNPNLNLDQCRDSRDYHLKATTMTEDGCSSKETRKWTESLKTKVKSLKTSRRGSGVDSELQEDLLEALDLLCEQVAEDGGQVPSSCAGIPEQIADALDESFSHWQQQLTQEFGRTITKELDRQIKHVQQLEKDLAEDREDLEERSRELEQRAASVNQREARISRQRKAVAKELKAKKIGALLELERRRLEFRDELRDETAQECEELIETLETQLASKTDELVSVSKEMLTYKEEIEELTEQLEQANEELKEAREDLRAGNRDDGSQSERIDELESELQEASKQKEEAADQLADLQSQVESLQQEQAELQENLTELEQRANSAEERAESSEEAMKTAEDRAEQAEERAEEAQAAAKAAEERAETLQAAAENESSGWDQSSDWDRSRIEELEAELEQLREELQNANQAFGESASPTVDGDFGAELEEMRQKVNELELQNSDLAAQLAKAQVSESASQPHVQFDQESLSWEERKALIMQQLESEADGSTETFQSDSSAARRVEIQDVIDSTQREIEKRDAEIAELRDIVEQQSDTRQGVAIGAAAIAQMLDSDDLVVQERQKLKEIQTQWEEKLRQAEIDVSLERARLARERQQLEAELEDARRAMLDREPPREGGGRTRKWLDHLGLREEKGQQ